MLIRRACRKRKIDTREKKWSVRKQREKEEQQLLNPFLGAYCHGGTQEVLVVLKEVRSCLAKEMMKVNESLQTMG